jgi:hypothetical protein
MGYAPGLQREQQGQHQFHQQSLEQQERYHGQHQEQSLPPSPAAIQDQPPDVLPYLTDRTSQSMNTSEDVEKTKTLSQETTLKIEELKRLVYRYSQYYSNPAGVIKCITYFSINGDNTLLDEKLEQAIFVVAVIATLLGMIPTTVFV